MQAQSIFITGAAAGIGRAIAERFHADGWFVGLFDVDEPGVTELARALGQRCLAGGLDVTDPAAWETQLKRFFAAAGNRLDVLVNNAGVLASGPFEEIELARHHAMIEINVSGVINGCRAAHPFLKQTPGACVVNMASASAIYGQPSLATYAASKFAVRGLTEGLSLEWQPQGIRVLDIWPIFVKTAMVDGMRAKSVEKMGVKLTGEDVAQEVARAVAAGPSSRKVHWIVGSDAKLFRLASRLLPESLIRRVTEKLATDH